MDKIIRYDNEYQFVFLEERIEFMHPASEFFYKLNDLSINLLISLKWIEWGFVFMESISKEIKKESKKIPNKNLINRSIVNLSEFKEEEHILTIDEEIVKNKEELENLIINFYNKEIFHENTKIHIKLKLNLKEFLILSHILYPTFIK